MSERKPGAENNQTNWVPMREPGLTVTTGKESVANFIWNPAFILYASQLEANAKLLTQISNIIGLTRPVEISPLNIKQDDEQTVNGKTSKSGEIAVTSIQGRVKKPKTPGTLDYDEESDKFVIGVNFSGLAKYVEAQLPDGTNDKNFYPKYGETINDVVLGQAVKLPLYQWIMNGVNYPGKYSGELALVLLSLTNFGLSSVANNLIDESFSTELLMAATLAELTYVLLNTITLLQNTTNKPNTKEYQDYLMDGINSGRYGRIIYPELLTKELLIPTAAVVAMKVADAKIIRGKN